jgi:hypothetical protein
MAPAWCAVLRMGGLVDWLQHDDHELLPLTACELLLLQGCCMMCSGDSHTANLPPVTTLPCPPPPPPPAAAAAAAGLTPTLRHCQRRHAAGCLLP